MRRTPRALTPAEIKILGLVRNPPYERSYAYRLGRECGWAPQRAGKVLERLARRGLVVGEWEDPGLIPRTLFDAPAHPPRRTYRVTAAGRAALETLCPPWPVRDLRRNTPKPIPEERTPVPEEGA